MKVTLFCLLGIYDYFGRVKGESWLVPRMPGEISVEDMLDEEPDVLSADDGDHRSPLFTAPPDIGPFPPDRYKIEQSHGSIADMFASNRHYSYPHVYNDLGRRHQGKPNVKNTNSQQNFNNSLIPKKASPEFVLAIAKKSLKEQLEAGNNPAEDVVPYAALRSGDFWNNVYVEEVDPSKQLRSGNFGLKHQKKRVIPDNLHRIRAAVSPGSEYYELISVLTKISPTLVYIVNNK